MKIIWSFKISHSNNILFLKQGNSFLKRWRFVELINEMWLIIMDWDMWLMYVMHVKMYTRINRFICGMRWWLYVRFVILYGWLMYWYSGWYLPIWWITYVEKYHMCTYMVDNLCGKVPFVWQSIKHIISLNKGDILALLVI